MKADGLHASTRVGRGRGLWTVPHSRICVPLFRYVILKRLVSLGRSKSGFAAVFRHHLRLQLLRAWRRPCNGVRTCFDGGENAFFGTAS